MSKITEIDLLETSPKTGVLHNLGKTANSSLPLTFPSTGQSNEEEIFDKNYDQGLELMCNDKLLKPLSSIHSVSIRKTTTPGFYKIILDNPELTCKVRYIDESQLINNRDYCHGTISKLNDDSYEITYFDEYNDVSIIHLSKKEAIKFIKEKQLIFQT